MTYRSPTALPRAGVWMLLLAVAVAGCMEASTSAFAAPDEARSASVMVHSADPNFRATELKRLREICGLGAPGGRYRSTIMCNPAEAADPQVRAIIGRPRNFADPVNPSGQVAREINRSVLVSIISTNTGVSDRNVKKVLDELDRVNLKNAQRAEQDKN